MACCNKIKNDNSCDNNGVFNSYFLILVLFILLAIIMGGVWY